MPKLDFSPINILNALAAVAPVRRSADIPYGEGLRRRLDIYAPRASSQAPPVVVFFYGGGWESGDRGMYRFVGASLASRGILTVVPDYRVYPEIRFPDFVKDGAEAVRWTLANVASHGGDPEQLALMGHSAGAHIAAMLAVNDRYLDADHARVRALVGLAGPYDFLPLHSDTLRDIFGPDRCLPASQPINFVSAGAPPAFLAAPGVDQVVDPGNTSRFAARLRAAGTKVETKTYGRTDHATILGAFSPLLRPLAPVLDNVARFIQSSVVTRQLESA